MDTLGFILFYIFLFILVSVLALGTVIPMHKKHKEVSNGIINYDSVMRKFVYKIYLSRQEVITLLKSKNEIDELTCSFNNDETIIKISEYGSNREYYIEVCEHKNYSILKLEQVSLIGMRSYIPFKLNPFIVNKLQAELVPFSQYGF